MSPSGDHPVHGSCLCGGVRYEVTAPFLRSNYCHCERCRKHSGAAALDDDPGIRPQFHSWVGAKAVWEELPEDGLRRFEGGSGQAAKAAGEQAR